MGYDIKPDHCIKVKRKCLMALTMGLYFVFLSGRVLWHFPSNEMWRNGLAMAGGVGALLLSIMAYRKYRTIERNSEKEIH